MKLKVQTIAKLNMKIANASAFLVGKDSMDSLFGANLFLMLRNRTQLDRFTKHTNKQVSKREGQQIPDGQWTVKLIDRK